MKKVISSDQVAHFWANQTQSEARNARGSMYFRGDTIYSYGSHFPIARHVQCNGKSAVLFTTESYSNTTAGHKSAVASAINHLTSFNVPEVVGDDAVKVNLESYEERITETLLQAKRARSKAKWHLERAEELINEGNQFAEFFGLKSRFAPPADWQTQVAKPKPTPRPRASASANKQRNFASDDWKH